LLDHKLSDNAPKIDSLKQRLWDDEENYVRFLQQVQIGLDAANTGHLIPASEIEAEAAAWRAETRKKITNATP
jgi:hypothetical protein